MQRGEDHSATTFFFEDFSERCLQENEHMAGDAVVHTAARHRRDSNQEQHHERQQCHAKPVAKLGQMADQRHLGAIALLLVLFSHCASALV